MNEQDRKIIEEARLQPENHIWPKQKTINDLVAIIDRLDNQLTKIVEAGEPFEIMAKIIKDVPRQELATYTYDPQIDVPVSFSLGTPQRVAFQRRGATITEKHFHRLAEALKGVKG